jgi:flagellar motility protein MotE (MotC chaperone)
MKKILFIVAPLLLVGGGVVGAAMMGVISIPGLSPAKKKSQAAEQYTEPKEEPVVKKPPPKEEEKPAEPNLEKGRQELAKLWNELEPTIIVGIVEKWSEEDLARQLRYLETEKSAAVISLMKPERASKVSKVLQVLGASGKSPS